MTENLDELADGWWQAQRLAYGTREQRKRWSLGEPPDVERHWARARELIDQGGEQALDLVLALLRSAPAGTGAATVGAGPLEDLVVAHGDRLAPRIGQLARRSPLFAAALAAVQSDSGEPRREPRTD